MFPRNPQIAIKYLKESMKTGLIQSSFYYCNQLIKGGIILKNIKSAKRIIEIQIKEKDLINYYLLLGKISKQFYGKSISYNNNESMYKYGRLLIKNKILIKDEAKGYDYIKKSINKGFLKGMLKYGIQLYKGNGINKNEKEGIKNI